MSDSGPPKILFQGAFTADAIFHGGYINGDSENEDKNATSPNDANDGVVSITAVSKMFKIGNTEEVPRRATSSLGSLQSASDYWYE